ncbi:hypothetical protein ACODT3_21840 [Streptomyces sp. 4.24]|uniref:hypothetical protein n=1 Tax=Streptomyces tritrimontium TaxID=3406573 RepID=UPI003BB7E197
MEANDYKNDVVLMEGLAPADSGQVRVPGVSFDLPARPGACGARREDLVLIGTFLVAAPAACSALFTRTVETAQLVPLGTSTS